MTSAIFALGFSSISGFEAIRGSTSGLKSGLVGLPRVGDENPATGLKKALAAKKREPEGSPEC